MDNIDREVYRALGINDGPLLDIMAPADEPKAQESKKRVKVAKGRTIRGSDFEADATGKVRPAARGPMSYRGARCSRPKTWTRSSIPRSVNCRLRSRGTETACDYFA